MVVGGVVPVGYSEVMNYGDMSSDVTLFSPVHFLNNNARYIALLRAYFFVLV